MLFNIIFEGTVKDIPGNIQSLLFTNPHYGSQAQKLHKFTCRNIAIKVEYSK